MELCYSFIFEIPTPLIVFTHRYFAQRVILNGATCTISLQQSFTVCCGSAEPPLSTQGYIRTFTMKWSMPSEEEEDVPLGISAVLVCPAFLGYQFNRLR